MRNNEEFRAIVFEKAEAYKENKKKKRAERRRIAIALIVCALIAAPVVYLPVSLGSGSTETAGGTYIQPSVTSTLPNIAETQESNKTSGDTQSYETSSRSSASIAMTVTNTSAATTVTNASTATTGTNASTATTGTNASTATTVTNTSTATTAIFVPDISGGDKIFANGFFAYKTAHEGGEQGKEFEYYYDADEFYKGELCEYAKGYISSSYFGGQSLIVAKITAERGVPVLYCVSGDGSNKLIRATVLLAIEEGKEYTPSTWILLIPVPKSVAAAEPENVGLNLYEYHLD